MHASMPPKRRLRGYMPESQEGVKVGSAEEEISPPSGLARVDHDRGGTIGKICASNISGILYTITSSCSSALQ